MYPIQTKNKLRLALLGSTTTPKLFSALQIAYGLCGCWSKIIVIGPSSRNGQYQHMGDYNTLLIPKDATPMRYAELLNISGACGKEVVIFSDFTQEWKEGVSGHLNSSYYEDILRDHRQLMNMVRNSTQHVICCIDTHRRLLIHDKTGKPSLRVMQEPIQQMGIDQHFTTVLLLDKKERLKVLKDLTGTLEPGQFHKPSLLLGALWQDWCSQGAAAIPYELQDRINSCQNLHQLYSLLFDLQDDSDAVMSAFAKRRLELDKDFGVHQLNSVQGGQP